jgi:hypothetical protein
VPKFAEALHRPWQTQLTDFDDIWSGEILSDALNNGTIKRGDIIFLQNRDGFCPLGMSRLMCDPLSLLWLKSRIEDKVLDYSNVEPNSEY